MGCGGGYWNLFREIEYYTQSRRGCGGYERNTHNSNSHKDIDEKITLIKKLYAEGLIDDPEYQMYKERIYNGNVSFEELMEVHRSRRNRELDKKVNNRDDKIGRKDHGQRNSYKDKIAYLNESKERLIQMSDRLTEKIEELYKEKEKMDMVAETILKSSEEKAEEYIRKRLDIEENIQNLEKSRTELQMQIGELQNMIKSLETKELEFEALELKEEITRMRDDLNIE